MIESTKRSRRYRAGGTALACLLLVCGGTAQALSEEPDMTGFERTPPRLSLVEGSVSFWRPGAGEWVPARVNTPLAAGDELYAGEGAQLEIELGGEIFVRADENTTLGLSTLEPDYLQFRLQSGRVSLDLRSVRASQTFELDTPQAAIQIERSGYYRAEVEADATTFTSRRGGAASLSVAGGESIDVGASEQVVVSGADAVSVESYAAPELDGWDRWNYARTDQIMESVSARYVSGDVYGVSDLDAHGDWRVVATYGPVWVPRSVPRGWAPYSAGIWIFDPYFGWTWVDDAPWGWAPFHYGRWVRVSGYWGWCPGPVVRRAYYAPALVAFFGGGSLGFSVSVSGPTIGWVALGWGEPIVPWWGRPAFRERAHWAGWAGPHVVNRVEVERRLRYRAADVQRYTNADVADAIVGVEKARFGRYGEKSATYVRGRGERPTPLYGDVGVEPDRSSLVGGGRRAARPPDDVRKRVVFALRESSPEPAPRQIERILGSSERSKSDIIRERILGAPRETRRAPSEQRAPFGRQSDDERRSPPPMQPYERSRPSPPPDRANTPPPDRANTPPPQRETRPEPSADREAPPRRRESTAPSRRDLPGEPANRVYRGSQSDAPRRDSGQPRNGSSQSGRERKPGKKQRR